MKPQEKEMEVLELLNEGIFTVSEIAGGLGLTVHETQNAVGLLVHDGMARKFSNGFQSLLEITKTGRSVLEERSLNDYEFSPIG